ncbi:hypothetical protein VTJ49DRAFT_6925 [Mycothermus thermophilus]|uniref:Uncharacterized protein n=1 Tax=Humicola insolens TaxID=85995 RepID=A0ABR3VIK2_HUMIN
MARDPPPDGFTFTHTPAVAFLNVPSTTFLSTRPLIRGAATGALVFSRAPVTATTTADNANDSSQPSSEPEDRILLIQRAPHDSMPLRWEIPGGACDPEDPTMLHGLARELWEEVGLRLKRVVREVGGEDVFLTSRGLAVSKVTCEVEVETPSPEEGKEALPEVVLDPNEHVRFQTFASDDIRVLTTRHLPPPTTRPSRDAMGTPPPNLHGDQSLFDSAQPFRGVVVCCTNIPTERRTDIAAKTTELGGVHKYDLTPDCTHLIVGDYNTAKYRHVAKERPDIRVMAAGWVEAVRNLWVQDAEIDFLALEKEWQLRTFETCGGDPTPDGGETDRGRLLCSITGIEDPEERQRIIHLIEANGGLYTGDLTKRCTHLIAKKPEGRKYRAAQTWNLFIVSVEWVYDSVERGLILDEKLYDPVLPEHERGKNAWNKQKPRVSALGKRLRESNAAAQDEGKRKLRKTASMKLNSQRDNLWGDILGKNQQSAEPAPTAVPKGNPQQPPAPTAQTTQPTQPVERRSLETQGSKLSSFGVPEDGLVFASCCFYVHGFSSQKTEILVNTIASLGGLICHSVDEVVSTSGAQMAHRFLIVPQTSPPDTHPQVPSNVHKITEFYIERCLHKKYFFDPWQHVIGRPFPVFPIPGFEELTICTSGFTGVDLNQVDKSIRQLGAKYEERFTANTSLLVCPSLEALRKQKLQLALVWKVPVVSADWLWECITTGSNVPIKRFLFPELKQNLDGPKVFAEAPAQVKEKDGSKRGQEKRSTRDAIDKDLLPSSKPSAKARHRSDPGESAFVTAKEAPDPTARRKGPLETSVASIATAATTVNFATAPTHALASSDADISFRSKSAPLSETSFNSLNKTPTSPQKGGSRPASSASRNPRKPFGRVVSEVADSEATDGDVGQLDDVPEDVQNAENAAGLSVEKEPELDAEAERKRLEAEAAAAERQAISNKLVTTILNAPPTAAAAAATDTRPNLEGNGDDAPVPLQIPPPPPEEVSARPARRKRNILGRAISNVSAASAGSSTSNGDSATGTTTSAAGLGKTDGAGAGAGGAAVGGAAGDVPAPASTQFKYEDPEAKKATMELRKKMMGKESQEGELGVGEAKLTLAGMGGYDRGVMRQLESGPQRRSRRR